MLVVKVKNLCKNYGDIKAVDDVSFEVKKGEIFGMLGPNGAGKTTTVECIEGLRQIDSGIISVLGKKNANEIREIKQKIGIQLQTTALFPRLTVAEILSLFACFFKQSKSALELIDIVGLSDKKDSQVKSLSGGQQQRLSVALGLINDPEILFLDEPTTGLDPQSRHNIWEVILDFKREGKTTFLTTHYMEEAEELCDRVAIIDQGKIIALNSPRNLIRENFEEVAIEIEADSRIKKSLSNLAGVSNVVFENDSLIIYTKDPVKTMGALFKVADHRENALKNLVMRKPTLEDVFLKLTGRKIRD